MSSRHDPRGMLFMLAAIALLSSMDAVVKGLVLAGVHPVTILAIRSLIVVPLLAGYLLLRGERDALVPRRPLALALRGLAGFMAPFCFFLALGRLPLGDALLVFFSSGFMITILGHLFLGERVGAHRWTAIAVGYLGVVVVMLPNLGRGDARELTGYLLALAASLAYAILFVSGRRLSATESTGMLVLSFNLVCGLLALLLLPLHGSGVDTGILATTLLVALLALGGHLAITRAFTLSEASALAPLEYLALLFALGYDALLFGHRPTTATLCGAAVIVASGLYVAHRERRRHQVTSRLARLR